jgi:hypothetical protein
MKIYVHLDEDSTPLPPHTLKIDDASSLSVANVIEQFCGAYSAKVSFYKTNIFCNWFCFCWGNADPLRLFLTLDTAGARPFASCSITATKDR